MTCDISVSIIDISSCDFTMHTGVGLGINALSLNNSLQLYNTNTLNYFVHNCLNNGGSVQQFVKFCSFADFCNSIIKLNKNTPGIKKSEAKSEAPGSFNSCTRLIPGGGQGPSCLLAAM